MPDTLGHAVGVERFELLAALHGDDVSHYSCEVLHNCIHRIASSGYSAFRFVTLPPQFVERFHRSRSNEKIL